MEGVVVPLDGLVIAEEVGDNARVECAEQRCLDNALRFVVKRLDFMEGGSFSAEVDKDYP